MLLHKNVMTGTDMSSKPFAFTYLAIQNFCYLKVHSTRGKYWAYCRQHESSFVLPSSVPSSPLDKLADTDKANTDIADTDIANIDIADTDMANHIPIYPIPI